jgi:type II secretory pathway pseudopilin PulG
MSFRKKLAFTLAEVLITLGIIGIVAEMTIPTLQKNVDKNAHLSALRNAYATLSSGFALALAQDSVSDLGDTTLFSYFDGSHGNWNPGPNVGNEEAFKELQKYFKISSVKNPQTYIIKSAAGHQEFGPTGHDTYSWAFPNGMIIPYGYLLKDAFTGNADSVIRANGGHLYKEQGWLAIDVNGWKKPNRWGQDVFEFYLGNDGKLYPLGGKDTNIYEGVNYWRTEPLVCGAVGSVWPNVGTGRYCAARIMEEGWQITY